MFSNLCGWRTPRVRACAFPSACCFAVLALFVLLFSADAFAGPVPVTYTGTQQTLFSSSDSSDSVSPIAADTVGDTFFVVTTETANILYEATHSGTLTALNSNFPFSPSAIAVNPAGTELYFIYYGSNPCWSSNGIGIYQFLAEAPVSTGAPSNLPCTFNISSFSTGYVDPTGLATDSSGNLYVADFGAGEIYKLSATITTSSKPSGQVALTVGQPYDIAVSSNGTVYFTALNASDANTLFSVSSSAFSSLSSFPSGTSPATTANNIPSLQQGLGIDATGTIYVGGTPPVSISGGVQTQLSGYPAGGVTGLAVDSAGAVFYAGTDANGNVLVTGTVAGQAINLGSVAVGATSATQNMTLQLNEAQSITSIRAAASQGGQQEFVVGSITGCTVNGSTSNPAGTTCTVPITFKPAYPGEREIPLTVLTSAGTFTFGLTGTGLAPQVALTPGTINTVAGDHAAGYTGDNGAATSAGLTYPRNLTVDSAGNLYIADTGNDVVRKVSASTGVITTVAGNGTAGYSGDGGAATSAELNGPSGVAADSAGNLYISDSNNQVIRKVSANTGVITTIAGNRIQGYSGDGGAATSAEINSPMGIALDTSGNLYIAEYWNQDVRKVSAATGTISTVAGNRTQGYSGDGGAATSAELNLPQDVKVDGAGNVYIADSSNNVVREVSASTGTISTVAGTGSFGYSGDGGAATSAEMRGPAGIALDSAGNLYIADGGNNVIRRVSAHTGTISTIAGSSTGGYSGDGGAATRARIDSPWGLALDSAGNLYIADVENSVIREVNVSTANLAWATATDVGSIDTTDGPQTATVSNIGNQSLTLNSPGTGSNPSYPANFPENTSGENLCASGTPLLAGATCNISANFDPTGVGANSGAVNLTDNALNAGNAHQMIGLSGTGSQPGDTTVLSNLAATPNSAVFGQTVVLSVQVVDSTNPSSIPAGTVTFTDQVGTTSSTYSAAVIGGFASYSYPPVAGAHTLTATFTPTNSALFAASSDTTGVPFTVAAYGPLAGFQVSIATSPVYASLWDSITITPVDSLGNVVTSFTGPVTLTSTDTNASFSTVNFTNGVGVATVRFATAGAQTVTVSDGTPSGISNAVMVQPVPNLVVTTAADDAGNASNCTAQAAANTGSDEACSLRDAVAFVNKAAVGNISFNTAGVFATPQTITLTNGEIEVSQSTTITGPTTALVTISGNNATSLFSVDSGDSLTVSNVEATKGYAASTNPTGGLGGAFYVAGNLTLNNVVLDSNQSYSNGGAVATGAGSTLNVNNCIFTNNSSQTSNGGAINNGGGTLHITGSTLSGNSASSGGALGNVGVATAVNTTFANNTATNIRGGAIYNTQGYLVTLIQSTVSGNTAGTTAGGIYLNSNSTLALENSIVAGNSAPSYADINPAGAPGQTYADNGGNLADDDASGISPTAPVLGPLSNYGGSFQTMIPLPGSPAICVGTTANASGLNTDERGNPRTTTYGSTNCVDAGAVQTNYSIAFSTEPAPIAPATVIVPGASFQAAVTLDESGAPFAPAISIPLALTGNGTLTNGTAMTSGGVATWSSLQVSAPGMGDELTATLPLNAAAIPALSLSVTSSQFNVGQLTPVVTFNPSPASQVYGSAIAAGSLDATATYNSNPVAGTIAYTTTVNAVQQTLTAGSSVLPAGSYTITATFTPSDTTTYKTISTTAGYMVTQATPTITWAPPAPITYGTALTGTQLNATATAAGSYTYTPVAGTVLNAGANQTLSVTFTPTDAADYTTAMKTVQLTVNKANVTVSGPAVTLTYGSSGEATVTVTAVAPASTAPTGTLVYSVNGGAPQTVNLTSGSAKLAIPGTLDAASYTIPVSYSGDSNYDAAAGSVSLTVNPQTTSIAVSATPSNPIYGTLVQLHGSLTPGTANVPVSSFSFMLDQGTPNSAIVPAVSYSDGTVTATYGQLKAGTHTAILTFSGTTDYTPSASAPALINVQQAAPALSWTPAAAIAYGTSLSALLDGTASYNTQTVPGTFSYTAQAAGAAALPVTAATVLPAGSYTLTANFTPTDTTDYKTATQSATLVVNKLTLTATANNATRVYGTANPSLTGTVTGEVNGDTFTESFTTAATISSSAGAYAIIPSVTGADLSDYTLNAQNGTLTVTQAASTTTLTSSTTNANLNAPVIFTATVTSATTGTPTGSVEFLNGSTVLGTAPLNAQGVATFTTSSLAAGVSAITALYNGDINFTASGSAQYAQTVTAPAYSISPNPNSLAIKAGQTGQVTFTMTPVGGFTGTVTFSCFGLPAWARCSFAPPVLTADGSNTPQTTVMTITTLGSATGTVARNDAGSGRLLAAGLFWLPALLFGGFLGWQRRKLRAGTAQILAMLLLVAVVSGAVGCGFSQPRTAGSSVVTVTATATGSNAAATSQTSTVTLTINQ